MEHPLLNQQIAATGIRRIGLACAVLIWLSTATIAAGCQSEIDEWSTPAPPDAAFDGEVAYEVLKKVVALGPRISATRAMEQQQEMLHKHFEALKGTVWYHEFDHPHPQSGRKIKISNMVVAWHPHLTKRIMICTHYDTRPRADRDPINKRAKLPGANDGASGVGLLYELGRHVPQIPAKVGVDFVFFDAEELVYDAQRDPLLVGSTGFANAYAQARARKEITYSYECAVLLDMIGDAHLDLYWEKNSFAAAEQLSREVWDIAAELNVVEFRPELKHEIRDDHLPLIQIARIPTIDIIDFDYPTTDEPKKYWHTQEDTPDKCSAESLQKVGSVMLAWIKKRVTE